MAVDVLGFQSDETQFYSKWSAQCDLYYSNVEYVLCMSIVSMSIIFRGVLRKLRLLTYVMLGVG